eukprot:TRINITY_DN13908_c0_g1_i1.p1 TRINITY_DN13908_c0_g1~~TRINITY_DN13908_c0_g1_i1.p1  ORF type:complete len:401 (-),score=77.19 TRINITY_DN13908_c0_g1_i1:21-1223(-)
MDGAETIAKAFDEETYVKSSSILHGSCKKELYPFYRVENDNFKTAVFKKTGGSKKKFWRVRYFVIYYNYVLYYKLGKNGKPTAKALPQGMINLQNSSPSQISIAEEFKDPTFQVPVVSENNTVRVYTIAGNNAQECEEWVKFLKQHTDVIVKASRRLNGPPEQLLHQLSSKVPKNHPFLTRTIPPDSQLSEFFKQRLIFEKQLEAHQSQLKDFMLFSEYYNEELLGSDNYMKWFSGSASKPNSFEYCLQETEQFVIPEIIKLFKDFLSVKEVLQKHKDGPDITLLKKFHTMAGYRASAIDSYNEYMKEIKNNNNLQFQGEKNLWLTLQNRLQNLIESNTKAALEHKQKAVMAQQMEDFRQQQIVAELIMQGYSESEARQAFENSGRKSVDEALKWLFNKR